jgi:hypothetical protein
MPDDVRAVRLEDPNYQAALMSVIQAVHASNVRDGSYQNGFSVLLVSMAMLIEREPGIATNQQLRERCEEVGRTILLQARIFRQRYEATGERQFETLSALIDELIPTLQ